MKTSFYFVLWIGIYVLIDSFGGQWLQQNSFFVAFAAVIAISVLINRLAATQLRNMAIRDNVGFYELVYRNDFKRYLGIFSRRMWFSVITFVYFVIALIFMLMVRESLIILAVFALLGFAAFKSMLAWIKMYTQIRQSGVIELNEGIMEQYEQYRQQRDAGMSPQVMCPPLTWKDRLMRGCNFLWSILSILIGILAIVLSAPGLSLSGADMMAAAMLMAYGGLALIYGINDLASTARGYGNAIS